MSAGAVPLRRRARPLQTRGRFAANVRCGRAGSLEPIGSDAPAAVASLRLWSAAPVAAAGQPEYRVCTGGDIGRYAAVRSE
jgi:hypothetical protein